MIRSAGRALALQAAALGLIPLEQLWFPVQRAGSKTWALATQLWPKQNEGKKLRQVLLLRIIAIALLSNFWQFNRNIHFVWFGEPHSGAPGFLPALFLGITSGSTLGPICDTQNRIWVGYMQSSCPTRCTISPPPPENTSFYIHQIRCTSKSLT